MEPTGVKVRVGRNCICTVEKNRSIFPLLQL